MASVAKIKSSGKQDKPMATVNQARQAKIKLAEDLKEQSISDKIVGLGITKHPDGNFGVKVHILSNEDRHIIPREIDGIFVETKTVGCVSPYF